MTVWLMSANESIFDHELAFKDRGYIDWKQTRNYCENDLVFIYCTKPTSRIRYMTKVIAVNETIDQLNDDSEFWKKPSYRNYSADDKFFRISLLSSAVHADLSLDKLQAEGLLRYPPQSPQKIGDGMIQYLLKYFEIRSK